jgi:hypothetical protein
MGIFNDHSDQGKVGYVIKMDKMFKLFRLEMLQMGQKTVENGFRGQFAEDVQDEWTVRWLDGPEQNRLSALQRDPLLILLRVWISFHGVNITRHRDLAKLKIGPFLKIFLNS